jgi:hypothetical protein
MNDEERQALAFQMSQNMTTPQQVAARNQRIAEVEAQAQMMLQAAANMRAAAQGADGLRQLTKTVYFIAGPNEANQELALYVLNGGGTLLTELVEGVHIDRIIHCEALCVARTGLTQFVPAHAHQTCHGLAIALGSPNACNVSSITFSSGSGYVLCDIESI